MRILVVCLGNICRSPLAEGVLQDYADKAGLEWVVESAGTNGYHNGEAPHHLSQKVARMHGLDISMQRSRKLVISDMDSYDKIYAMAADVVGDIKQITGKKFNENKVELFLEKLCPNQNKDVPDPWYGGEDGYHKVFQLIEEGAAAIVKQHKRPVTKEKV